MSKVATRKSFGKAIAALGEKYPNVVCLDADLSKSTTSNIFAQKFPERFFEMGIQEANMVGCAAGLSFTGKIPFACSFGAFLTGRFDQIRMSIGYAKANVKLIGTHSGIGIGEDGHSQMGLEDISLMRTIPEMVVLQPADDKECFEMIEWAINHKGPVYFRLTRHGLQQFDMEEFQVGKFQRLKSGENIAFLASGGLLEPAYQAAHNLDKSNICNPAVYNASTAKPLNDSFMDQLSKKYDKIVVFEDHSVVGGIGSAVSEWISEHAATPRRVVKYGLQDTFGESGTPEALYRKYGFTAEAIEKRFTP